MKKFTQLLALVACMLTFVSQTAFAATDPGSLNFSYAVGSGDWTYSNPMTKSGSKYTFTVQGANNEDIHFLIHKNSGSNWNSVVINNNVYSTGKNNEGEITVSSSPTTLYLYGECDHCLKLSSVTGNVTFSVDFSGSDVELTYTVGSVVNPDPDPTPGQYTIYFFDGGNSKISNVKAYVWNGSTNNGKYPGVAMTDVTATSQKYVYYNSTWCNVWSYTIDSFEPKNVIFTGDGMSKTGDLTFRNGAFYKPDGTTVNGLELQEKTRDDVVTLYFHWKEDYVKKGTNTPRCHVFKGDDASANNKGVNSYTTYDSDEEKMYLVSEKYQIWGFDVLKSEISKYDNVKFFYYGKSGGGDNYVASAVGTAAFDRANWTKYIYTVHDGQKAYQSYLSYEDFLKEAAKGYPYVYVVGGGDEGQPNKMEITVDGQSQQLSWNPDSGVRVNPDTPQDATFYIQLKPTFNGVGSSTA